MQDKRCSRDVVEGIGRDRELPTSSCKVRNEAVSGSGLFNIGERCRRNIKIKAGTLRLSVPALGST